MTETKIDILIFLDAKRKFAQIPITDRQNYMLHMLYVNQLRADLKQNIILKCKMCAESMALSEFLDDCDRVCDECIDCRRNAFNFDDWLEEYVHLI